MIERSKAIIGLTALVFVFSMAYAADVQLSQGVEIELTDINSSIYMGQDYNFTNVTVYGDTVTFKNDTVSNNLSVSSNTSVEINSTLENYTLNNPTPGKVFEIETDADPNTDVTYNVDAKQLSSGDYELFRNGASQGTVGDGSSTLSWSYGSDWTSNNTFTLEYSGNEVKLNWTDGSDNEDGFRIYSNATGTMDQRGEVGPASGTGSNVIAYDSTDLNSGEYIEFKVRAYNSYGESSATTGFVTIP